MNNPEQHVTSEELLLFLDGELEHHPAEIVQAHLAGCQQCSNALEKLTATLRDVEKMYSLDPRAADAGFGQRTRLRTRLQQEAHSGWRGLMPASLSGVALRAALVIMGIALGVYAIQRQPSSAAGSADVAMRSLPNPTLTPGNVTSVSYSDICPSRDQDQDPPLPPQVQDTVFREYGVSGTKKEHDFQVDYLISPQLGGTSEIRNLWPEPYQSTVWNAAAKDALEVKLNRMVCQGEINLTEAQQEIATDWIAAYKKYFRTETPLQAQAVLDAMSDRRVPFPPTALNPVSR